MADTNATVGESTPVLSLLHIRPLLPAEQAAACCNIVNVGENETVSVQGRQYAFDCVVGEGGRSRRHMCQQYIRPLVQNVVNGVNCAVLAYGQTSSGKTYTMGIGREHLAALTAGDSAAVDDLVIPYALRQLFDLVAAASGRRTFTLLVSFVEVYMEKYYDLLARRQPVAAKTRCDGEVMLVGAQLRQVASMEDVCRLLQIGGLARITKGTSQNDRSSRSHAVLTIHVQSRAAQRPEPPSPSPDSVPTPTSRPSPSSPTTDNGGHTDMARAANATATASAESPGASTPRSSYTAPPARTTVALDGDAGGAALSAALAAPPLAAKLHLVDLAGSESVGRAGTVGLAAKEGNNINLSLMTLRTLIQTLAAPKSSSKPVLPYRDSKLTMLLRVALGGNSSTLFVACVSPADANAANTVSTLEFATTARRIRTKPAVNIGGAGSSEVLELHRIILKLRSELDQLRKQVILTPGATSSPTHSPRRLSSAARPTVHMTFSAAVAAASQQPTAMSPSPSYQNTHTHYPQSPSCNGPQPSNSLPRPLLQAPMQSYPNTLQQQPVSELLSAQLSAPLSGGRRSSAASSLAQHLLRMSTSGSGGAVSCGDRGGSQGQWPPLLGSIAKATTSGEGALLSARGSGQRATTGGEVRAWSREAERTPFTAPRALVEAGSGGVGVGGGAVKGLKEEDYGRECNAVGAAAIDLEESASTLSGAGRGWVAGGARTTPTRGCVAHPSASFSGQVGGSRPGSMSGTVGSGAGSVVCGGSCGGGEARWATRSVCRADQDRKRLGEVQRLRQQQEGLDPAGVVGPWLAEGHGGGVAHPDEESASNDGSPRQGNEGEFTTPRSGGVGEAKGEAGGSRRCSSSGESYASGGSSSSDGWQSEAALQQRLVLLEAENAHLQRHVEHLSAVIRDMRAQMDGAIIAARTASASPLASTTGASRPHRSSASGATSVFAPSLAGTTARLLRLSTSLGGGGAAFNAAAGASAARTCRSPVSSSYLDSPYSGSVLQRPPWAADSPARRSSCDGATGGGGTPSSTRPPEVPVSMPLPHTTAPYRPMGPPPRPPPLLQPETSGPPMSSLQLPPLSPGSAVSLPRQPVWSSAGECSRSRLAVSLPGQMITPHAVQLRDHRRGTADGLMTSSSCQCQQAGRTQEPKSPAGSTAAALAGEGGRTVGDGDVAPAVGAAGSTGPGGLTLEEREKEEGPLSGPQEGVSGGVEVRPPPLHLEAGERRVAQEWESAVQHEQQGMGNVSLQLSTLLLRAREGEVDQLLAMLDWVARHVADTELQLSAHQAALRRQLAALGLTTSSAVRSSVSGFASMWGVGSGGDGGLPSLDALHAFAAQQIAGVCAELESQGVSVTSLGGCAREEDEGKQAARDGVGQEEEVQGPDSQVAALRGRLRSLQELQREVQRVADLEATLEIQRNVQMLVAIYAGLCGGEDSGAAHMGPAVARAAATAEHQLHVLRRQRRQQINKDAAAAREKLRELRALSGPPTAADFGVVVHHAARGRSVPVQGVATDVGLHAEEEEVVGLGQVPERLPGNTSPRATGGPQGGWAAGASGAVQVPPPAPAPLVTTHSLLSQLLPALSPHASWRRGSSKELQTQTTPHNSQSQLQLNLPSRQQQAPRQGGSAAAHEPPPALVQLDLLGPWLDALLDYETRLEQYGKVLAGALQEREAVYSQLQLVEQELAAINQATEALTNTLATTNSEQQDQGATGTGPNTPGRGPRSGGDHDMQEDEEHRRGRTEGGASFAGWVSSPRIAGRTVADLVVSRQHAAALAQRQEQLQTRLEALCMEVASLQLAIVEAGEAGGSAASQRDDWWGCIPSLGLARAALRMLLERAAEYRTAFHEALVRADKLEHQVEELELQQQQSETRLAAQTLELTATRAAALAAVAAPGFSTSIGEVVAALLMQHREGQPPASGTEEMLEGRGVGGYGEGAVECEASEGLEASRQWVFSNATLRPWDSCMDELPTAQAFSMQEREGSGGSGVSCGGA